jgi:hypothetical protein
VFVLCTLYFRLCSIIFQTLDLHYAPYSVLHSCTILYSCTCSALFRLCFRLCSVMCYYTVLYSALQDPLLCPLLALPVSGLTMYRSYCTLFLYLLCTLFPALCFCISCLHLSSDLLCISVFPFCCNSLFALASLCSALSALLLCTP